ncbi:MAG: hypothetical protein ACO3YX_06850 [Candidatus Nanopelagicaceae bacterium]
MGKELKLNEFHTLYVTWKQGIPWFDHLLLGLLVWIERWVISQRIKDNLDTEIEKFLEEAKVMEPNYVAPIYTEQPGEGSFGVSELRLTAPWYRDGLEGVERDTEASRGV